MKSYWGKAFRLSALALLPVLCLNLGKPAISVHATEETKKALQEAKDKLNNTKDQLSDTQDQLEDKKDDIGNLHKEKTVLESKLNDLNEQLAEVSSNLEDLEGQIEVKEEEISTTQDELAAAISTRDEQYAAMKKRVQFIYEKQGFMLLDMLTDVGGFADFLNQSDYVAALSAYDRKMLEQYKETCVNIDAKEKALQTEKAELDECKDQVEAEQSRVSGLVTETNGSISQYKQNISTAEEEAKDIEEQARAYESQVEEQNKDVKALEAKLAEEIRLSKLAAKSKWRNISEVSFAEGDRYLLANLIYCEAGGEPYEGKVAVGAVVINRVLSSVYPDTVVGVIYQSGQFSPVGSGRLALALANGSATESCYQAADAAMGGATNVGNCVYFRTPIPGLSGINIGGHVFY
ncbi:cell wall hydrolase [Butyrivibrio sp. FC2001]|uniref:cell wall hydrolase n=1 Tax=Butyrivibrio sp. FC2001 TaxID=1280671 RepID=UPI00041935DD|nr:cell wall hydrolase [Butyrivibrio sp. FC2001]